MLTYKFFVEFFKISQKSKVKLLLNSNLPVSSNLCAEERLREEVVVVSLVGVSIQLHLLLYHSDRWEFFVFKQPIKHFADYFFSLKIEIIYTLYSTV